MLIPAIILVLWLKPAAVRLNVPWLVGGIVAGLALYLPYVFGEMAHGWENTRGMIFGGMADYSLGVCKFSPRRWVFWSIIGGHAWTFRPG